MQSHLDRIKQIGLINPQNAIDECSSRPSDIAARDSCESINNSVAQEQKKKSPKKMTLAEARAVWASGTRNGARIPYHPAQENYKDVLTPVNDSSGLAVLLIGAGRRGLNPMFAFPEISNFFIIDRFDPTLFDEDSDDVSASVQMVGKEITPLAIDNKVVRSSPTRNVEKYSFHSFYRPEIVRNITIFRLDFTKGENIDFIKNWIYPLKLVAVVFGGAVPHHDAESLTLLVHDLSKNNGVWIEEAWGSRNVNSKDIYFDEFLQSKKNQVIDSKRFVTSVSYPTRV